MIVKIDLLSNNCTPKPADLIGIEPQIEEMIGQAGGMTPAQVNTIVEARLTPYLDADETEALVDTKMASPLPVPDRISFDLSSDDAVITGNISFYERSGNMVHLHLEFMLDPTALLTTQNIYVGDLPVPAQPYRMERNYRFSTGSELAGGLFSLFEINPDNNQILFYLVPAGLPLMIMADMWYYGGVI